MNTKDKKPRIVILTSKLPEDIWLVNSIAEVSQVVGIVLPVKSRYKVFSLLQVLKKRTRQLGILPVIDQALLILYRLIFERSRDEKALKQIFTGKSCRYIEDKNVDMIEVEDINCEEVGKFAAARAPDLVVVSGTPILKKGTIKAINGKIINLHPGMAPEYRGRYGAFWPIYNREPELVGVTVHFLDEGIDTGRILLQQRINYDPADTLKTIAHRQHRAGVELLVQCLTNFDAIAAKAYQKTGCPSHNYLAPGITHYFRARRWLRHSQNGPRSKTKSAPVGKPIPSDIPKVKSKSPLIKKTRVS
jgi:folate-dependent phosphoribosylglycinamide formyltransferase PurN